MSPGAEPAEKPNEDSTSWPCSSGEGLVKPMRNTLGAMALAITCSGCDDHGHVELAPTAIAAELTPGEARAQTARCDGLWLRLQEPYEFPGCADLSKWKACIVADGHDPKELRIEVTPLPPPQQSPKVRSAPEFGRTVLLVEAPVRYPLGALFWIHAYPKGGKPPDCADVHVGFPFSHDVGQ